MTGAILGQRADILHQGHPGAIRAPGWSSPSPPRQGLEVLRSRRQEQAGAGKLLDNPWMILTETRKDLLRVMLIGGQIPGHCEQSPEMNVGLGFRWRQFHDPGEISNSFRPFA